MEFDDLPASARPRAIALGLAELLRGAWPWLATPEPPRVSVLDEAHSAAVSEPSPLVEPSPSGVAQPEPSEPSVATPPPDPERLLASLSPPLPQPPSPAETPARSPNLHVGGKALRFLDAGDLVWGGQALGEYGRWSLGAQLLTGSTSTPRGDIALRVLTGSLGFTALELSSEPLEFRSGVRLAVGRASADGTPLGSGVKGAQGAAPYLGAMLSAGSRWWFSKAWSCTLEAEGGYASGLVATVDGRAAASLAGWLGGLSVGVSFAP
jgi:hypothetical protein